MEVVKKLFHNRIFNHKCFHICRTVGQHHYQTFSARWSQSTEAEGLGTRVISSEGYFLATFFTI